MKATEVDILHQVQNIQENSRLLTHLPKTPQQHFALTYAAIHFINKGHLLPILDKLLQLKTGACSQLLLRLKYMKQCMQKKVNLQNKDFHVLNTLVLWMQDLPKVNKSSSIKLVNAILLPHPHQLKFQAYQQFIVYLNYLAGDIQNLFKVQASRWTIDDLILFLQLSLPRIHYNILLPVDLLQKQTSKLQESKDFLFCNLSVEYFTRTRPNYRGLCKLVLSSLIKMQLKPSQLRYLIDLVCRYYLLFWSESKQNAIELFINAFSKCSEAVRFSLADELLLFFKICQKLGAIKLQTVLREKYQWINNLLIKYKPNIIGYPKDDVNPYNPLNIKEKITVQAGKSVERILQIYQEETLFYFTVLIDENDINLKLFYLGDFDSKIEVKKLLHFDQKKSGENKFAYLAAKKGIYMIQFDNSYSWINSKSIVFEYVVLTQLKVTNNPIWLQNLFQLNSTKLKKENIEIKPKMQEINSGEVKSETIQTHNLQQIYSSFEQYEEQQLEEQDEIEISHNISHNQKEKIRIEEPNQLDEEQQVQAPNLKAQSQVKKEKKEEKQKIQSKYQEKKMKQEQTAIHKNERVEKNDFKQQEKNNVQKQIKKENIIQQNQSERRTQLEVQKLETKVSSIEGILKQEGKSIPILGGQANLSLIDSIFSLLVSTQDHTYQFETNLEDRILKRLKSYCQAEQQYQWIVNSQARDWLKKKGFSLTFKGGVNVLGISGRGVDSSKELPKRGSQRE